MSQMSDADAAECGKLDSVETDLDRELEMVMNEEYPNEFPNEVQCEEQGGQAPAATPAATLLLTQSTMGEPGDGEPSLPNPVPPDSDSITTTAATNAKSRHKRSEHKATCQVALQQMIDDMSQLEVPKWELSELRQAETSPPSSTSRGVREPPPDNVPQPEPSPPTRDRVREPMSPSAQHCNTPKPQSSPTSPLSSVSLGRAASLAARGAAGNR